MPFLICQLMPEERNVTPFTPAMWRYYPLTSRVQQNKHCVKILSVEVSFRESNPHNNTPRLAVWRLLRNIQAAATDEVYVTHSHDKRHNISMLSTAFSQFHDHTIWSFLPQIVHHTNLILAGNTAAKNVILDESGQCCVAISRRTACEFLEKHKQRAA